jgi:ubiquinone/menaquinone biosynthesis C-methylase UbiE
MIPNRTVPGGTMTTATPPTPQTTMKARAREQFAAWAGTYDRSLLHHFLFRPSYIALMEEIARWYDRHQRPFRVLDIGCGTGELAAMLATSDWPVEAVGMDYVPEMCMAAGEKLRGHTDPGRAWFAAGDSEFLPFADASFDIVTCSNSFHHYPHQQAVVHKIKRLLRPAGRFVLIDGFRDNVVGWFVFDVVITRIEGGVFHAPWSTIDGYFRNAGFTDIHRRKINFWMPLCVTVGSA